MPSTRTGRRKAGRDDIQRCPSERDAAARHDHVDMGMVGHRRAPCVEHGGDADARAEMLRIGGDRQHRLRCRPEQQVIDQRLVVEGDVGDLGGQREHDVEVADRQQVGLALGEPCTRGRALALRAVPVAAAVVGDPPLAAVLAGLDVTAQCSGAAVFDRRHHLELLQAQMPCMGGPVGGPGSTEDVGDLQVARAPVQPGGVLPSISAISRSSGPATAWIVRVETLV